MINVKVFVKKDLRDDMFEKTLKTIKKNVSSLFGGSKTIKDQTKIQINIEDEQQMDVEPGDIVLEINFSKKIIIKKNEIENLSEMDRFQKTSKFIMEKISEIYNFKHKPIYK